MVINLFSDIVSVETYYMSSDREGFSFGTFLMFDMIYLVSFSQLHNSDNFFNKIYSLIMTLNAVYRMLKYIKTYFLHNSHL